MLPHPPKNILCPIDFSDISALGLQFANALAQCSQARLTVLFADPFLPPPYFTHGRLEEVRQQLEDSKKEAERSLKEFVETTLGAGAVPHDLQVVEALAVDGILSVAAETSADLIAMGTHGRSGVNRLMLGSVAERVLRGSKIPVLTVRPGTKELDSSPAINNIVCPVNNSEVARRSLHYAAQMAQCFGAELTVLHVKEPDGKEAIDDLCAWVPSETRSLCSIREMTRDGEAAQEIVAVASELSCDLLVIAARHRRFFDSTIIGTTTVRVVRHAPCAVFTVVAEDQET
jgi:nucleotide-binding universal stress UspA family protein